MGDVHRRAWVARPRLCSGAHDDLSGDWHGTFGIGFVWLVPGPLGAAARWWKLAPFFDYLGRMLSRGLPHPMPFLGALHQRWGLLDLGGVANRGEG
ncbi:MAG: hypothetical protein RBU30_05450 [Polyangia bacterium]|jgi:hypothetical protein|nr:hypothetical protein [Polyangia bacterium]